MVVMEMTLPNLRISFRDHTAKIDRANKHRGRMNCSILYFSSSDLLVKVRQETPKAQASLPPQWSIGRMRSVNSEERSRRENLQKISRIWKNARFGHK